MEKITLKKLCTLLFLGSTSLAGCASLKTGTEVKAKGLENTKKFALEINGALNGMFITSTDESNPVLLFISGGPGVPEIWLNEVYAEVYPNKLAEHFTVCYWDYYGEGLSYNKKIEPEEITLERLAADAREVARYLKTKYNKEKIYLMAHSSGSHLGLYLAQTDSEDFYCYFGMGQDYSQGSRRYEEGYKFMKAEFEKTGNKKDLKKMNKLAGYNDQGQFIIKKEKKIIPIFLMKMITYKTIP